MTKEKIELIVNKKLLELKILLLDTNIAIFVNHKNEILVTGYGCPKCTQLLLKEWCENSEFEHNKLETVQ